MNYYVLEGEHTDPNDITTINQSKQQIHGPMVRSQADTLARQLVMKNIDNYYHRAWVIDDEIKDRLVLK
jgi:hypothetical protein